MGEERDWTPERCPNIGPIGSRCSHYAGHKERLMFECDFLACLEENKRLVKKLEDRGTQLSQSSNTVLAIARDLAEAKNRLDEVEASHKHHLSGVEASQAHYKDLLRAGAGEDIPQAIIRVMKERDEFRSEVLRMERERAKAENSSDSFTVETPSGKYSCTYYHLKELLGARENEFLPDAIQRVLKEKELLQKHVNSLLLEKAVEEKIKRDRQGRVNHLNQELANADKLAFEYNTILRFLDGEPVHSETLDRLAERFSGLLRDPGIIEYDAILRFLDGEPVISDTLTRLAERFSVLLKDPSAIEKEIPESPQQDPEGYILDSTPIKSLEVRVDDLEETVQALWHLLHAGAVQINSIDKTLGKLTGEDQ